MGRWPSVPGSAGRVAADGDGAFGAAGIPGFFEKWAAPDRIADMHGSFLAVIGALLVVCAGCASSPSEGCAQSTGAGDCQTSESTSAASGCEELAAESPSGATVAITLRNDRAVPIFVPWSVDGCTWEPFTIWMQEQRVFWDDAGGAYIPSCEALLEVGCGWGCSDGPASVLRLDPGATHELSWDGYVWSPMAVDAACAAEKGCPEGGRCWAGRQLSADPVQARIRVMESCEEADCDCGSVSCIFIRDSLSVGGLQTETVIRDVVYDGSDIVWAIGP